MLSGQPEPIKDVQWIASSRKDLHSFTDDVQDVVGHDLWIVQNGDMPSSVKPIQGYKGIDVIEIIEEYNTDTYRVICTVRFKKAVYILHAFRKKSKHGIKTPQKDMDIIKARLRIAEIDYAQRYLNEIKNQKGK